jgi:hypothetical protein
MADKVVGIKIDVQDSGRLSQLEQNLVKLGQRRRELNKLVREGTTLTDREAKELGELGTQAQATRNKINDLKNGILKQNDALKKNSGFVAGIRKGIGQWATSMIGVTAAIAGVTALVGNAIQIFRDFEKANSQLAAVSGATAQQMEMMKNQAKELGSTTAFTASQVTELQTEFAKLGFPTDDILDMTGATLSGAAALGSELGEQAALTGALLKQFGLDANQATRVNDVLATAASKSALDFNKLSTALPIVGATANAAGKTIEETTVLLGKLSDRGIDASTAGTSLRNIFLELSKQGLTFEEAMQQINESTDKNKTAMDLFGKRSATAGIILADMEGTVTDLDIAMEKGTITAKGMADTMLNNLSGDITKAESAWEGFILSIEDGDGVISKAARSITQEFTGMLGQLTKLNEGDFFGFAADFAVSQGILTDKQARYNELLAKNAGFLKLAAENKKALNGITTKELTELVKLNAFKDKELEKEARRIIVKRQQADELKKLAEKRVSDENQALADEVAGSELSDKEKEAINKKAKARAKAKQDAQAKALKEIEDREQADIEASGEEGSFEDEINKLVEEETAKAEIPASIRKEIKDREADEDIERNEKVTAADRKAAEDQKEIEALKRNAKNQSIDLAAKAANLASQLAEEGSTEQKALAITSTLISTYLSAQQAYASQFLPAPTPSSPIRGAVAASIALASGLANVKKITSVKAANGMITGASHAMGGVPFSVDGQLGFEAEGGEAIINKKSTQMFRPLLSAINEAGGGVSFAKGGKIKKFQNGGIPNNLSVSSAQQGFLQRQLNLEEFSSTIIEGINNKQVINVASNTSDVATEVFNTQSEATF